MKYFWISVCLVASCCGGGSQKSIKYVHYGSADWLTTLSQAEREVYYDEYCQGVGTVPGTRAFFDCVVDLEQNFQFGQVRNQYFAQTQ